MWMDSIKAELRKMGKSITFLHLNKLIKITNYNYNNNKKGWNFCFILTKYNQVIQWEKKKNVSISFSRFNAFKFVKRSDKVAAEVLAFACMCECLRNNEMTIYGCERNCESVNIISILILDTCKCKVIFMLAVSC